MSEDLMESVAPQLAPPVTREPVASAREGDGGTDVAYIGDPYNPFLPPFADDDAE